MANFENELICWLILSTCCAGSFMILFGLEMEKHDKTKKELENLKVYHSDNYLHEYIEHIFSTVKTHEEKYKGVNYVSFPTFTGKTLDIVTNQGKINLQIINEVLQQTEIED